MKLLINEMIFYKTTKKSTKEDKFIKCLIENKNIKQHKTEMRVKFYL